MNEPNHTATDTEDRTSLAGVILREAWYFAAPSQAITGGKTTHKTLLGEPVLIGRDKSGNAFALRDTCPHAGTLLSRGRFDGQEVECPYHGWRFATDGRCTLIPSQTKDQRPQPADIRAQTYRVHEGQGGIWVYFGVSPTPGLPPQVPVLGEKLGLHLSMIFECNIDMAVSGLMDPAHGAFVHRSAIWRTQKSIYEKRKAFSPLDAQDMFGWRMDRHQASSNSRAYRLFLGGAPQTEISYMLPSTRIEHASTGKYQYCGLTACTPIDAGRTEVHHAMYWNVPGGALLIPLVRSFARRFLDQDRRAVMDMVAGLQFNPPTMLVRDADQQTRWYYKLKREWLTAASEGRTRRNQIAPTTLTWRS